MTKTMRIDIYFTGGGGTIEREITYHGENMQEIAEDIDRDENELLQYMLTGDDKGQKAFCFCGFMFKKSSVLAAKISEPFFD